MQKRIWVSIGLILLCANAWSQIAIAPTRESLIELATIGPTIPAEPFYRLVHLNDDGISDQRPIPRPVDTIADPLANRLPLHSILLTPGVQPAIQIPSLVLFTIPVFVVGAEPQSFAWLVKHRELLQQRHAIGYVVEVVDQTAWDQLRRIAGDISMYPINGDGLATELGLQHYPVLLSQSGVQPNPN